MNVSIDPTALATIDTACEGPTANRPSFNRTQRAAQIHAVINRPTLRTENPQTRPNVREIPRLIGGGDRARASCAEPYDDEAGDDRFIAQKKWLEHLTEARWRTSMEVGGGLRR